MELGDKLAQPLPVLSAANEVFKTARRKGFGDQDFSAVIEAVMEQDDDDSKAAGGKA